MTDDWVKDLLDSQHTTTSRWRSGQRKRKKCQWVENATGPIVCSGIVSEEGTEYCPYHSRLWEERYTNLAVELKEVEKERKRRA